MISWMKKLMKDVPKLGGDSKEDREEEEAPVINQSYDHGDHEAMPPTGAYIGNQEAMVGQVIQRVESLGHGLDLIISNQAKISAQISNKKDNTDAEIIDQRMDELMEQIKAVQKQVESQASQVGKSDQSPMVYALGGIIIGMVGAVIMVGFINKSKNMKKRAGKAQNSLLKGKDDFETMEMNSMDDEKLH